MFVESSDSFIGRMIGVTILKKPDYSVIAKAKGESDAIEKLRANGPDLDLVIINIVETDDIQMIKAIREINNEIPIIALTPSGPIPFSASDLDDPSLKDESIKAFDMTRAALRAGANDFYFKPLKPDGLLSVVNKVLGEP